ncbi:hypothetical protein K503DRAFT_852217 [Rhizopogon vinicolor AM-OR11-026]|uniref:Cora-domain-containing protein n=1 Tax=Rhizopogon vinicolor AM-OR11-026 TaxID=1314800 RepID=A0A1B7MHH3_9AGAM|nr:hypothetical protein K503DRAFT_852217 [Rhizopogon vinicolor AM-OR11-026]
MTRRTFLSKTSSPRTNFSQPRHCSTSNRVSMPSVLLLLTDAPSYRHASPSGPWPWMDFRNVDVTTAVRNVPIDRSWRGYPQNLFKNWTHGQVDRSQMLKKCLKNHSSTIYWLDVLDNGEFATPDMKSKDRTNGAHVSKVTTTNQDMFWEMLQREVTQRPGHIRVRSLFVDDLTSPMLRMLGTTYNIEPFFFTSSINWIPSRYQEALSHQKGDHITITLPFVRTSPTPPYPRSPQSLPKTDNQINTQAPLHISDDDELFIDLLAIHMVRDVNTSTIISYHPESTSISSAKRLHSLMQLVGDSVYWQHIFSKSKDPTFLLLALLWYALYAWDESLEALYNHIMPLESDVLTESRVEHTRDLHSLQAYLLNYESLLHGVQVSVSFIEKTPNPAMESEVFFDEQRKTSDELMKKECDNLLNEIDRLQKRREMLGKHLKNVMDLAFANVNIRDSASMRQVTYLTMIFLPASLIASVFGMNVKEINPGSLETTVRYMQITIALTAFTFYVVVTLQTHTSFHERGATLSFWSRFERLLRVILNKEIKKDPPTKQHCLQWGGEEQKQ